MAKFNHGVLTKAKGKLGGVVFQQYEGMQIGKEYQPNVKNPQTDKQVATRAKFKVSTAFTCRWWPILRYLKLGSNYDRYNRGKAVNVAFRSSQYREEVNIASVDITTTLTALNEVGATSTDVINFTHTGTFPNIIETANPSSAPENSIIYARVVSFDDMGKIISFKDTISPAVNSGVVINMPSGVAGVSPESYQVMAVMVTPITNEGYAIYSQVIGSANTDEYQVAVTRAISSGDMIVTPVAYDHIAA